MSDANRSAGSIIQNHIANDPAAVPGGLILTNGEPAVLRLAIWLGFLTGNNDNRYLTYRRGRKHKAVKIPMLYKTLLSLQTWVRVSSLCIRFAFLGDNILAAVDSSPTVRVALRCEGSMIGWFDPGPVRSAAHGYLLLSSAIWCWVAQG